MSEKHTEEEDTKFLNSAAPEWDINGGSVSRGVRPLAFSYWLCRLLQVSSLPISDDREPYPWFAVYVRPRREKFVAVLLRNKGFAEFLPLYCTRRRWSDRMKEVEEALFPGYLFCRFNLNDRLPILSTPWVTSIVGIGGTPAPVDESEIASLRCIVDSGLEVQPWPFLHAGDRVRIANGPLSSLEGILVEVKKQNRLVISVTLLQRSVAVPIDRSEILPIGPPRPKEKTALLKG